MYVYIHTLVQSCFQLQFLTFDDLVCCESTFICWRFAQRIERHGLQHAATHYSILQNCWIPGLYTYCYQWLLTNNNAHTLSLSFSRFVALFLSRTNADTHKLERPCTRTQMQTQTHGACGHSFSLIRTNSNSHRAIIVSRTSKIHKHIWKHRARPLYGWVSSVSTTWCRLARHKKITLICGGKTHKKKSWGPPISAQPSLKCNRQSLHPYQTNLLYTMALPTGYSRVQTLIFYNSCSFTSPSFGRQKHTRVSGH